MATSGATPLQKPTSHSVAHSNSILPATFKLSRLDQNLSAVIKLLLELGVDILYRLLIMQRHLMREDFVPGERVSPMLLSY